MNDRYRFVTLGMLLMVLLASIGWLQPQASSAQQEPLAASVSNQALLGQLSAQTNGAARVSYHSETGAVRFIGTNRQHPLAQPTSSSDVISAEQTAMHYAQTYGQLFGLRDPARELTVMRVETTPDARTFVRYQQVYNGIPIVGGELIVQTSAKGELLSLNGEVLPQLQLDTTPTLDAAAARDEALTALSKTYALPTNAFVVSTPTVWIYNPIILGGPGLRQNTLVWRMEVTAPTSTIPVREFVLVDARRGVVALHFNQIADVKERHICNAKGTPDTDTDPNNNCDAPAKWVRSEGQAPVADGDVNLAYDYSGITYDYFFNRFGRNSIDNAGMPLISLVRYCPSAANCPYENAFWNGRQMTYGAGYASADDVVGHELAHGVTEFTAGLFYYYQSGALSESMSDLFGELIDFTAGYGAGRGNDASNTRWLMGEDLAIGAIRDMKNPEAYDDPDKTSSFYYVGGPQDSGGVHTNSGVNNKAVYLLTDGGTFNGRSITALGEPKVAQIYYEALSRMMTSATNYQDLYDYLQQACINLVGTYGISNADCQEVNDAVTATEMNLTPDAAPTSKAPMCNVGTLPIDIFFDDLENPNSGNWAHSAATGIDEWYYPSNVTPYGDITYATSGRFNMWGNAQGGTDSTPLAPADYSIAMTKSIVVPPGAYLHFAHSYGFEADFLANYDGGVVEYSTNNGASWNDAGSLFIDNGYNGTIVESAENPLSTRDGFVDHSNGYGSSRADLSSLAGQSVRFRFRIGTDSKVDDYGWFIDDVRLYRCDVLSQKLFVPLIKR